jgi:outer membrane lipase/esterase
MKKLKLVLGAALAAALVAGCGGGGGSAVSTNLAGGSVKVVGDSLADSGVFGFKWAMQGNAANPMLLWTDRIAATFGGALCPRYGATSATTVALNPAAAACTSYAVGGGRINFPLAATTGFAIPEQMKQLATEKPYSPNDLLLVDGGGNDAADLVGAYIKAGQGSAGDFVGLTGSLGVSITAPGAAGLAQAGTAYMQALADKFYSDIKVQALDKGARKVAVLNMPGITNTPRFQDTLNLIAAGTAAATPGDDATKAAAGAAARAQSEALFKSWVEAFNARLASKFAGESRVLVIDFYSSFNDQIANPAQYGLTNVKTPACPTTGTGADGLPTYNAAACTADSLSATTPPAGAVGGSNWWKTYAFSDGFHPTIYGYQLLGQLVAKELAVKGWL